MKSTELRIGNLVDLGNRIAKVIDIGHLSCTVVDLEETQDTLEDYERTQGILLTEEWLEKFGAKLLRKNYSLNIGMELFDYTVFGDIVIYRHKTKGWTLTDIVRPNTYFFQYVHQLQNLYFALTGEELTLK